MVCSKIYKKEKNIKLNYVAVFEARKLKNQTTFNQHFSPTFGKFYQLRYRFVKDYYG